MERLPRDQPLPAVPERCRQRGLINPDAMGWSPAQPPPRCPPTEAKGLPGAAVGRGLSQQKTPPKRGLGVAELLQFLVRRIPRFRADGDQTLRL